MANIKKISLNGTSYDVTDQTIRSSVANEYSATGTYDVGDYCVKDGIVYKCNTAISTAETWNASHWTEVKVMDEIESAQGSTASADKLTTARGIDGVKFDGTAGITHFCVCGTAAATAAKEATIYKEGSITDAATITINQGTRVVVQFTNGSTVASPTLKLNGGTAYAIKYRGTALTASQAIKAKAVLSLIYAGGAWEIEGTLDGALDATVSGLGMGKTITALSEVDGIISASASNISITRSQVSDLSGVIMYYGTCSNTATEDKVVTVQTGFALAEGVCVRVLFTNGNVTTAKMNVNDTGLKEIKWRGADHSSAVAPDYVWSAGSVIDFVYDGTAYEIVDNGLNYVNASYTSGTETLVITVGTT